MSTYLCRFLGLVALVWLAGTGTLPAQIEYAVLIREPKTRKTYFGEGTVRNGTHDSRLFGVSRIDFANPSGRTFTFQGILHAKKQGRVHVFSSFSDRNPTYTGLSYLLDVGRGKRTESLVLTANDPDEKTWLFPQGTASSVQLVTGGTARTMATKLVSSFGFAIDPLRPLAGNYFGMTVTLDPALSRRLNARSPADLTDAGNKLITLLVEDGWQDRGFDTF